MTAPLTSSMDRIAASLGLIPFSAMLRSTFSTTTMASSTTMPIARTSPKSVTMFIEKPNSGITAKVPMSDTGIAMRGIKVALQLCKKTKTTSTTRKNASNRVVIT